MDHPQYSIVQDAGSYCSSCGYCKSGADTSCSHGMSSRTMTVSDYQDLIDQGWRRSGTFLYKPNLKQTCCPPYTIRLDTAQFQPSKAQRSLMKKWDRYLAGELDAKDEMACTTAITSKDSAGHPCQESHEPAPYHAANTSSWDAVDSKLVLQKLLQEALQSLLASGALPQAPYPAPSVQEATRKQQAMLGQDVSFTSSAALAWSAAAHKAAAASSRNTPTSAPAPAPQSAQASDHPAASSTAISSAQRKAKVKKGGKTAPSDGIDPESISQLLVSACNSLCSQSSGQWQLGSSVPTAKASRGYVNFVVDSPSQPSPMETDQASKRELAGASSSAPATAAQQSTDGHRKGNTSSTTAGQQSTVGQTTANPNSTTASQQQQQQQQDSLVHRLQLKMVRSQFIREEFELYKKYQVTQHNDDPDEVSVQAYTRFLVDSPLQYVSQGDDPSAPPQGYGSFHQQYWLDGKLVAVGVVDVLPRCLSSVYLFWDVDFAFLAPGKFSALKEIEWVQQASQTCPQLHYYYMGFFIQSCQKMRYKAQYSPSDLLCPQEKVWVRITPTVLSALEQHKYVVLSQLPGVTTMPNPAVPSTQQHGQEAVASPAANAVSADTLAGGSSSTGDDVLLAMGGVSITWKEAKDLAIIPRKYWKRLQQELDTWVALVGASCKTVVYALS